MKYRLEAHRKDGAIGQGRSTVACLIPGFHFKMQGFGRDPAMARMGIASTHKLNQAYLVTQITHEGEQPQSLDQDAPESSSRYHNRFEVIPEGIEWRAHHYFHGDAPRKPRVDGPQLARVVGPKGEEIFCDDYGRVKLQFPWDRHGKGDESSSCWVRVSQLWAGTKYGGMAIPRIGQEVIVEFLDGDIDQPIITGRTYNAHNLPPYDLPLNKTMTTLKSNTHKGKGFNELSFEDESGKEEVYLHAQRDRREVVERNSYHTIKESQIVGIGSNLRHTVNGQLFLNVKKHANETYQDDKRMHVAGSLKQSVGASQSESVSDQYSLNIGDTGVVKSGSSLKVESGRRLTLTAKDEIVLKSGSSRIRILSDGSIMMEAKKARFSVEDLVEIVSKLVDIN